MKNKYLKRLTTVIVGVAMVATMVTGFSVDVKAAPPDMSSWPASVHTSCGHSGVNHFWATGETYTQTSFLGTREYAVGREFWDDGDISDCYDGAGYGVSLGSFSDDFAPGWYYEDEEDYLFHKCSAPTPAPTPTPTPSKSEDKKEATKEAIVDHDTFKSEAPYGTVGVTNNNSKIGDLKVHKVTAITEANQKLLANYYAQTIGKKARILTTVSVHPRRDLGADNGKIETLIWNNLEKKVQPVYAVCYNQKDGAYFISGTLDANGTAKLNNFVLRDATNVTIFVLE